MLVSILRYRILDRTIDVALTLEANFNRKQMSVTNAMATFAMIHVHTVYMQAMVVRTVFDQIRHIHRLRSCALRSRRVRFIFMHCQPCEGTLGDI